MGEFDLRSDAWIPGLRVADPKTSALAASLRLDAQRPCSACGEASWLDQHDLEKYDKGVPLLCAPCVADAFVEMPPRLGSVRGGAPGHGDATTTLP